MPNELFEQLRKSIIGEARKEMGMSENANSIPQGDSKEKTDSNVSDSLSVQMSTIIYSVWKEWNKSMGGYNPVNNLDVSDDKLEKSIEDFTLEFNPEDFKKVNMSSEEATEEKEKIELMLLLKTKKQLQAIRASEIGKVPDIDSEIYIQVSTNRMAAWAFVLPQFGNGAKLSRERIKLAFMEYSVESGIDDNVIEEILNNPVYFKLILIAYGKEAIEGKDGKVIEHFNRELDSDYKEDEQGNIDYYSKNNVQQVHKDDIICEVVPPQQGEDGYNVMGVPIKAKEISTEKLSSGRNTVITPDGLQLKATIDGHLKFYNGVFNVEPIYYVGRDVDLSIGNINFQGDIEIAGDVRENIVIQAGGSIVINGYAEAAIIEAGKDVTIKAGVLGDGKGVIKAGGKVTSKYIESACVISGGDVISGSIIDSEIFCDQRIECKGERGTVIGGKLVAGCEIQATTIGSRAERLTWISLGQRPYRDIKIKRIVGEMEEQKETLKVIEKTLNKIDRIDSDELTPELSKVAADYRIKKPVITMKLAHLEKELEELKAIKYDDASLSVKANEIYPKTEVHINDSVLMIKDDVCKYCKIHLDGDKIVTN